MTETTLSGIEGPPAPRRPPRIAPALWPRVSACFDDALALPAGARPAWLDALQRSDPPVADALRRLLAAHAAHDEPAAPGAGLMAAALAADPVRFHAGDVIGIYRLVSPLGSGGMASVWLAEQTQGVLRRVALKLPHPGLEAPQAMARRFESERNLLAQLEHPNIARLYDAGLADRNGAVQPFLAMELVDGQPLTHRAAGRPLRQRLQVFLQVCAAVSFAHGRLVIHRDLKPSNILLTPAGQVRLLDFGIARLLGDAEGVPAAAGAQAGAPAVAAGFTPDCAAPEQLAQQPLGAAADVYALGVVLFELLTGQRPYTLDPHGAQPLLQQLQALQVPWPSSVAPAVDQRALAGDLDTITARAMALDPAARYASVEALADDLQRHLAQQPVVARGRSGPYLLGCFLRRNRGWVAAGSASFVALAAAAGLSLLQAQRADVQRSVAERAAAREEALRYYLVGMFRTSIAEQAELAAKAADAANAGPTVQPWPSAGPAAPLTAKAMLDRSAARVIQEYSDDPQRAGKVAITLADLYGALGDVEGQVPLLEGFLAAATPQADPGAVALARQKLANIELLRGHTERAAALLGQAEAHWAQAAQGDREPALEAMLIRGTLQRTQGDLAGSLATYKTAIATRQALSGDVHRETALLFNSMAITLTAANQLDAALAAYRHTLAIFDKLGRSDDLDALVIRGNTGTLAFRLGHLAEAEAVLKSAVDAQRRRAGDSPAVAASLGLYGAALAVRGQYLQALPVLREALALADRFAGPASPLAVRGRLFLADALMGAGDLPAAAAMLDDAQARAGQRLGPGHLLALRQRLGVARLQLLRGNPAAARADYQAVLPLLGTLGEPARTALADAQLGLGEAWLAMGRPADAVPPLRAALALREQLLWAQSWDVAQARVLLGDALRRSGHASGAPLLAQGLAALQAQLGPAHVLTVSAQAALAAAGP